MNQAVAASPDLDAAVAEVVRQSISNPTHMITVPASVLPGGREVAEFQVAQFLCSRGADGRAVLDPNLPVWTGLNHDDSVAACIAVERRMLTETRALALAINLAGVAANWTGGAVGAGKMKQGLRKWSVRMAQPACFVPPDADEDRWLTLSTGERICDFSGNCFTRVFNDIDGDARGLVTKRWAKDSPSLALAYPDMESGFGWRPKAGDDWSGVALVRGGYWNSEGDAGVFNLVVGGPGYAGDFVGFRYTN